MGEHRNVNVDTKKAALLESSPPRACKRMCTEEGDVIIGMCECRFPVFFPSVLSYRPRTNGPQTISSCRRAAGDEDKKEHEEEEDEDDKEVIYKYAADSRYLSCRSHIP